MRIVKNKMLSNAEEFTSKEVNGQQENKETASRDCESHLESGPEGCRKSAVSISVICVYICKNKVTCT